MLGLVDDKGHNDTLGWPLKEGWYLILGENDWDGLLFGADKWDRPEKAGGASSIMLKYLHFWLSRVRIVLLVCTPDDGRIISTDSCR